MKKLHELRYGDILMFKPKHSLVSKLISKIDGSPYSHSGFFLGYFKGVPIFIEAHENKGGVVMTKLENWDNYNVFRPAIKARPMPITKMLALLNTRYDMSRLWWIFKAKILGFDLQNNDSSRLICSELVDYGWRYVLGGAYLLTPAKIYNLYQAGVLIKVK